MKRQVNYVARQGEVAVLSKGLQSPKAVTTSWQCNVTILSRGLQSLTREVLILSGVAPPGFCGNREGCSMHPIWVWIDPIDLCVPVGPSRSDSTRLGLVSPKVGPSYGKSVCERLKLVTRGTTSCNVCFSTNVARYCSLLNDNGATCWMAMKAFNFCRTRIKNYFHFWRQIWKWRMTKSSCHCVLQALLALVPFKLRWIFTITCCGRPI